MVANQPPAFVNPYILSQQFKQDFGALARLGTNDAEAPISNLLVPLRVLRSHTAAELRAFTELTALGLDPARVVAEAAIATYHEAAHQALLRAMGTSLEELRALRTLSATQRRDLLVDGFRLASSNLSPRPTIWLLPRSLSMTQPLHLTTGTHPFAAIIHLDDAVSIFDVLL